MLLLHVPTIIQLLGIAVSSPHHSSQFRRFGIFSNATKAALNVPRKETGGGRARGINGSTKETAVKTHACLSVISHLEISFIMTH